MLNVKGRLDNFMYQIREQNPNASWENLLTGIGILVLIAVASVWYFGKVSDSELADDLLDERMNNGKVVDVDNGEVQPKQLAENEIEVLSGEGLWQIAERVCGDAEKYNLLAEANGLTIWSEVAAGQVLVVDCGDSE